MYCNTTQGLKRFFNCTRILPAKNLDEENTYYVFGKALKTKIELIEIYDFEDIVILYQDLRRTHKVLT